MRAFEVLPYDAARRDDYLRLLAQAWGERGLSGETFDWWFEDNPVGSARVVAVRDGSVIGAVGHSRFRARLGGRERVVEFSLHAVTDPIARGQGVFTALERALQERAGAEDAACALVVPNRASRPLYQERLGWTSLAVRRVWARPLRGALVRLLGRRPRWTASGAARRVERFGEATDALYERLAPSLGNHLVRDARHLTWRYLDAPREYRVLGSETGFAVLGRTARRGASLAVVMDVLADPGDVPALVRACVQEAGSAADALLALPTPCLPRGTLARLGFAPTPVALRLLGIALGEPLDARADAWTLAPGDTDFL